MYRNFFFYVNTYHKESEMEKGQDEWRVIKPEEIVIGLHQGRSFDYCILVFYSKCHFCNYHFQLSPNNQNYLTKKKYTSIHHHNINTNKL